MSERKNQRIDLFIREALPVVKDVLIEPIRFSQTLKERLTDVTKIPNYDNLSRVTKAAIQLQGYMWGYLPIEISAAMASGLVMQGDVISGLLVGTGAYLSFGVALKHMNIRNI